jgi:hypothetical protein
MQPKPRKPSQGFVSQDLPVAERLFAAVGYVNWGFHYLEHHSAASSSGSENQPCSSIGAAPASSLRETVGHRRDWKNWS